VTFVLDVTPELAVQRRRGPADRVESREAAFHARVRAGFRAEVERRPDKIMLVDATQSAEAVQQVIRQHITAMLSRRADPSSSSKD
jgi:dTMP kinase